MLVILRRLYHSCKLVHADLSEYNILYHKDHLYVIDVSQSVEHDHPHAFDFLRSDITNVEEFWGKRGVKTLGLRRTFEWITGDDQSVGVVVPVDDNDIAKDGAVSTLKDHERRLQDALTSWMARRPETSGLGSPSQKAVDHALEDAVFKSSYIPRNLNEVYDPERDVEALTRGEGKSLIYGGHTGVVAKFEETSQLENTAEGVAGIEENSEEEVSETEEGADAETDGKFKTPGASRHEDRNAKRVCEPSLKQHIH